MYHQSFFNCSETMLTKIFIWTERECDIKNSLKKKSITKFHRSSLNSPPTFLQAFSMARRKKCGENAKEYLLLFKSRDFMRASDSRHNHRVKNKILVFQKYR